MTGFNWDDAAVQLLTELTVQRLSCSQIGNIIGVSRNAIIGKQHRIGLRSKFVQFPGRPTRRYKPKRKYAVYGQKPPTHGKMATEIEPEHIENPTGIFDLKTNQCRWPVANEGIQMLFCGDVTLRRHSYCAHHCCKAFNYIPVRTRAELELYQRKFARDRKAQVA
jgi:GcrA cell cycle regulator